MKLELFVSSCVGLLVYICGLLGTTELAYQNWRTPVADWDFVLGAPALVATPIGLLVGLLLTAPRRLAQAALPQAAVRRRRKRKARKPDRQRRRKRRQRRLAAAA